MYMKFSEYTQTDKNFGILRLSFTPLVNVSVTNTVIFGVAFNVCNIVHYKINHTFAK